MSEDPVPADYSHLASLTSARVFLIQPFGWKSPNSFRNAGFDRKSEIRNPKSEIGLC